MLIFDLQKLSDLLISEMTRFIILLYIISFSLFVKAQNGNITLLPDEKFPLWLKTDQSRTNQTS